VTQFKPTYSNDFTDVSFVENCIKLWQEGAKSFTLKTSGSTGTPKKISLSRKMLQWSAEHTYAALELKNEHILCCLPVTKTGGFMQLIRALVWDCPIYFSAPTADPLAELPHRDFTITSLTPHQVNNCIAQSADQLNCFQNILIGGAPLGEKQASTLLQVAPNTAFWETYGMTETASHIALRKVGVDKHFQTQTGVQVTLDDELLCIAIPELDFFIKTNDIAKLHHDSFQILGRSDDVINSGGIKIHPALIEPQIKKVLESASINRSFYVTKKNDIKLGEKAVLVIEGPPITDKTYLLELLKRDLSLYHNPKEIIFVDHIAYTDTGKIKRVALE